MLRNWQKCLLRKYPYSLSLLKRSFLTNEYMCNDSWNKQTASKVLNNVNLSDFYNVLDQKYSSKGVISAIDVDVFVNATKDPSYLEELKDLLHKLRLSAETGNTLDSTHHATVRNFIQFGNIQDLIHILKDPLNFGIFLDVYAANILLDKLLKSNDYEQAANVASLVMLQEDFSNEITCTLCQYACYKFILEAKVPQEESAPPEETQKNKKVEEIKIRVKYLRNPYFDDHFDIKDIHLLSGKTLAWISERGTDNLSNNLQIIGWLFYKKYDNLLSLSESLKSNITFKVHKEVIELLQKQLNIVEDEHKAALEKCIKLLSGCTPTDTLLEYSIKIVIENAINKAQNKDIAMQQQLFKSWADIRIEKLEEQSKRLDRAKRIQGIEEKQKALKDEEQKLWFFDNEELIDLEIENKEKLSSDTSMEKKTVHNKSDENYVPPEILPKRK